MGSCQEVSGLYTLGLYRQYSKQLSRMSRWLLWLSHVTSIHTCHHWYFCSNLFPYMVMEPIRLLQTPGLHGLKREDEPVNQISSGTLWPGQEDKKLVKGRENSVDLIVAKYHVIQVRQDTEKWDSCHDKSEPWSPNSATGRTIFSRHVQTPVCFYRSYLQIDRVMRNKRPRSF